MPDLVVIHYTAMADAEGAIRHLCNPEAQVSAHYVICAQGQVTQLVEEAARAWHAGASSWGGESDINSRSIGIELANTGATPFAEAQMAALEVLLEGILARWRIPPKGVVGHSDIAPGRKIDPGRRFDWQRLARQGLAVWGACVEDPGEDGFWDDLKRIGYTADVAPEVTLDAFRARWRPTGQGPLGPKDWALARDIATRFPVDPPRRQA